MGANTEIKAIIFDCFGVLSVSTYKMFYERYFAGQPEKVERAHELDHASNQGRTSLEDFYKSLAELAEISVNEVREFMSRYQTNTELLAYIKATLKPQYKIGFLSNVADNLMDNLFTLDEQALFDDVMLSFEVKLAKPDKAAFELAAKRLAVKPQECIFVDDIERYCAGARAAGMQAICYTDFKQFKSELEAMV